MVSGGGIFRDLCSFDDELSFPIYRLYGDDTQEFSPTLIAETLQDPAVCGAGLRIQ
jgi:hypothetical protein